MANWVKLLVGLVAVLLLGWISHGPLGNGERFVASLEAQARRTVADTDLSAIQVRLDRSPLRRAATLSGPANDFQRNGMGSLKGLTGRVADVPGMGRVRWSDEKPPLGIMLPLLAEICLLMIAGYLLGLVLAMLFLRPPAEGRYA